MQGKKEEKTNYSTIKIADDCVLTQEKVEPEVFKLLKSYFKKPENVLDIILNNKELSDEVVITNLTTLNLKANRFGDDGAIAIGKNTTWTVLAILTCTSTLSATKEQLQSERTPPGRNLSLSMYHTIRSVTREQQPSARTLLAQNLPLSIYQPIRLAQKEQAQLARTRHGPSLPLLIYPSTRSAQKAQMQSARTQPWRILPLSIYQITSSKARERLRSARIPPGQNLPLLIYPTTKSVRKVKVQ